MSSDCVLTTFSIVWHTHDVDIVVVTFWHEPKTVVMLPVLAPVGVYDSFGVHEGIIYSSKIE